MERELFCVSLMMMVTFATMAHHIHEHGDGAGARAVLEGIIMYTMHTTAARGCRGPHVTGVWGPGVSVPAAGARRPPAELTPVQPAWSSQRLDASIHIMQICSPEPNPPKGDHEAVLPSAQSGASDPR